MDTESVHIRVLGRVQGVGYRAWLARRAKEAGLRGWVRNCRDGSVESALCGPAEIVRRVVEECWSGPALARVTNVALLPTSSLEAVEAKAGFSIMETS